MAKFSSKVLQSVAGFDGQIMAQELVYRQRDFWNMTWSTIVDGIKIPVDLTGADIDAQIVRRTIENLEDTRSGMSFDIRDYPGNPVPINLAVVNTVNPNGTFTLVLDDTTWGVISSDVQLDIAIDNPVCFSGRIKVSFPVDGTQPAYDEVIFLLFLIRSDGVVS